MIINSMHQMNIQGAWWAVLTLWWCSFPWWKIYGETDTMLESRAEGGIRALQLLTVMSLMRENKCEIDRASLEEHRGIQTFSNSFLKKCQTNNSREHCGIIVSNELKCIFLTCHFLLDIIEYVIHFKFNYRDDMLSVYIGTGSYTCLLI